MTNGFFNVLVRLKKQQRLWKQQERYKYQHRKYLHEIYYYGVVVQTRTKKTVCFIVKIWTTLFCHYQISKWPIERFFLLSFGSTLCRRSIWKDLFKIYRKCVWDYCCNWDGKHSLWVIYWKQILLQSLKFNDAM